MRNIKHHRLASVNREEESKELWVVVRRNPAFKVLHALFDVFWSPATRPLVMRVQHKRTVYAAARGTHAQQTVERVGDDKG